MRDTLYMSHVQHLDIRDILIRQLSLTAEITYIEECFCISIFYPTQYSYLNQLINHTWQKQSAPAPIP